MFSIINVTIWLRLKSLIILTYVAAETSVASQLLHTFWSLNHRLWWTLNNHRIINVVRDESSEGKQSDASLTFTEEIHLWWESSNADVFACFFLLSTALENIEKKLFWTIFSSPSASTIKKKPRNTKIIFRRLSSLEIKNIWRSFFFFLLVARYIEFFLL